MTFSKFFTLQKMTFYIFHTFYTNLRYFYFLFHFLELNKFPYLGLTQTNNLHLYL